MSTLTSSPSPAASAFTAASPRASFHISRPRYTTPSPRSHPRSQTTAASPRHAFWTAPPTTTISTASRSGSKQVRVQEDEATEVERRLGYVDSGTQYSPEGYPPTAGRHTAGGGPTEMAANSDSKRKQRRDESPRSLSAYGSSSSGSSIASNARRRPPPEPEPRINPAITQGTSSAAMESQPSNPPTAESTQTSASAPKKSRADSGSVKVMPMLYQNCNSKTLGVMIAIMLMDLIRLNDQIPLRDDQLTRFHSRAPPGISVHDYLQRLIHHATISPPILLSMVWYIDRLCQLYPTFTLNSLTVHRFLITAATVAAKGLSDSFYINSVYAKIGGISVSELAILELEFLQKMQWKIVPQPEVLVDYYTSLVERTDGFTLEGRTISAKYESGHLRE
ncbi:Pho80p cyclin [Vermiconidia calcicola]|uniref:Pho80p cyclin n=1 Tax=Vermiconidia calcicola TaxID=1690605 RepID=A0ACC3NVP6_9PEZI|nr:Pho80p cyclin [Vermiconidia calcicola]